MLFLMLPLTSYPTLCRDTDGAYALISRTLVYDDPLPHALLCRHL